MNLSPITRPLQATWHQDKLSALQEDLSKAFLARRQAYNALDTFPGLNPIQVPSLAHQEAIDRAHSARQNVWDIELRITKHIGAVG